MMNTICGTLRRLAWALGGILLAGLSSTWAWTAEPWEVPAFSAKPEAILQAAQAMPIPKDVDVEILFQEVSRQYDSEQRCQCTIHRVARWLTEKATEENSNAEATWAPWHDQRPVIRARVITPDGVVHLLDAKNIAEVPVDQESPQVLSDRKVLRHRCRR